MSSVKEKIQTLNNIKGKQFETDFHLTTENVNHWLFKVFNEPLPYLVANGNQLITATSSNKIGIHSNIDKLGQVNINLEICIYKKENLNLFFFKTQFSMDKLKPDSNFKAPTSSLIYLPMNQTLLLGSDNGDIKLLC